MPEEKKVHITELKKGNAQQIRLYVAMYADPIYQVCLSYVFNHNDAEELTQDVLMAGLDKLEKFEGKSSLKTWLHRIAVNKSLDFLKYKRRKKRAHKMIPLINYGEDSYGAEIADTWHPGVQLESQEQMAALYHALEALPDRQRTALTLSKLEGRSQREVAEIMEIHIKAVESLLQRAKKNLKKKLIQIFEQG